MRFLTSCSHLPSSVLRAWSNLTGFHEKLEALEVEEGPQNDTAPVM